VQNRVSATEAVRSFSDLLNRIRYRGDEFIIERGGEAVCRMTPAMAPKRVTGRELAAIIREVPHPDTRFAKDVHEAIKRQGRVPRSRWGR
jgi:antitoxin (DNA-binding transcriptional repressor) of toxin-antitoxin stability system